MAYQWEAAIQESCKTKELLAADANKYRLIERWIEVNSLGFCQLKLGRLEEAERTLTHALDALAGDPPAGDDWGTSPLAAGMPHVLKSVAHRHLAAVYQAMMQERRDSPEYLAIMRKKTQAEAEAALSCAKQIDAHVCSKESAVNVAVSQVTFVGSLQQTAGQDVKVLERALGLLDSAIKELGSIGDDWRLASAYIVKGRTLKNLERYDEAEAHLLLARSHSGRIKRLDTDRSATRELLEIKEKLGDVDACNRLRDDLSQPPVWAKTN
jgi:tetratricopeptide (TPR) repeat protein